MASAPRIRRLVPKGQVTTPEHPLPVFARLWWYDGSESEVPAVAIAWTREAVEVMWEPQGSPLRSDWIPANDVRRTGDPPKPPDLRPNAMSGKRQRWNR